MGLMEFILDFAELCIWPITLISCLLIVRAPLGLLIPFAQSIKYKDFELQFSQELSQVSQQAQQVLPNLQFEMDVNNSLTQLLQHANHLPNHSIFQAWANLNLCARNILIQHQPHIVIPSHQPYKFVGEALINQHLISEKHAKLFHELRQLRNKVAHAPNFEVSTMLAKQYVEVCFALIDALTGSATLTSKRGQNYDVKAANPASMQI